jgi:hypothetical protein
MLGNVLTTAQSVSNFFIYYTMVGVAIITFTGWKLFKRTKFVKPLEADLVWERPQLGKKSHSQPHSDLLLMTCRCIRGYLPRRATRILGRDAPACWPEEAKGRQRRPCCQRVCIKGQGIINTPLVLFAKRL